MDLLGVVSSKFTSAKTCERGKVSFRLMCFVQPTYPPGVIFAGYGPLASQSPYPFLVYSVANYRPHVITFRQICTFRDPTFYFYELTHFPDLMKHTLLFICSTNILVRLLTINMKNCLTPPNPKMCDPILVTLLKMRPHCSQKRICLSSRVTTQTGVIWAKQGHVWKAT